MNRLWLISNYNQDPSAVIAKLTAPYLICNQGDVSYIPAHLRKTGSLISSPHTGHNISDYLEYIIGNYNNLPDSLGFAKGNLFPRHITEAAFLARQPLEGFVPLYSETESYKPQFHWFFRSRLVAQQVAPGYYIAMANNWYAKHRKPGKFSPKLQHLFGHFVRRDPPWFISFVPGACMIVPADKIQRHLLDIDKQLHEAVTSGYLNRCFRCREMHVVFF